MIDWLVLLVPLLLIPIVLLLVFVGCILDRAGQKPGPIFFSYQPGLDDVAEIRVRVELDSQDLTTRSQPFTALNLESGLVPPEKVGEVSIDSEGQVVFSCTVTMQDDAPMSAGEDLSAAGGVLEKEADEPLPVFHLSRDGMGGFQIVFR
jgi:hypothetical protein